MCLFLVSVFVATLGIESGIIWILLCLLLNKV